MELSTVTHIIIRKKILFSIIYRRLMIISISTMILYDNKLFLFIITNIMELKIIMYKTIIIYTGEE